MWPIYLLGLIWAIPQTPAQAYLTLILNKHLGFNTFTTNLLTVPANALFILQLIFWTWVSEKWNNRFMIVFVSQVWMFPLLVALETLPGGDKSHVWARYACNALLVGYPYIHAILGECATSLLKKEEK